MGHTPGSSDAGSEDSADGRCGGISDIPRDEKYSTSAHSPLDAVAVERRSAS